MSLSRESLPARVSVLISGYGPVGAALACLLGRYGVQTLVIDQASDILRHPRAIALDNEALRILQMAGLEEQAFETVAIPQVKMHCPYMGEFTRVNTAGSIDGHPKLVTFYQPELEEALRRKVETLPTVTAVNEVRLLSFDDQGDGVCARLSDSEGITHTVQCDYLVGADGASSKVREAIGESFKGCTHGEDWLIVDARHAPRPIDHVEFICDHRRPGPHMVAPGDRQRWEFMLHPGENSDDMLGDEKVAELLAPWSTGSDMEIERKAVYRFHSRCARHFSKGRVFLAGDAAHITPPFVGQGLVAGLRDAANLAWKLAWVVQGRSAPSVLASYSTERRPHALAMIRLARMMGALVMPRNALLAMVVHGLMRMTRLLGPTRRFFEELQVKPANAFRRGLFGKRRDGRWKPGTWFPQSWVRTSHGTVLASDETLGDHFCLVGLGVDPLARLSPLHRTAFEAIGGQAIQVGRRGQAPGQGLSVEDITDNLIAGVPAAGQLVLVRPDRVVMGAGNSEAGDNLVEEALALLGAAAPNTFAATIKEVA